MDPNLEDLASMAETLEQQELVSPNGIATTDVYKQLLTIYLLNNETVNAKFLWKRVPEQLKKEDTELQNVWSIGQYLWKREFSNVFLTVSKHEWSAMVKPLMNKLIMKLRDRLLSLISQAYSSIKVENLCHILGLDENEVVEMALTKSWELDLNNKILKPIWKEEKQELLDIKSDDLMKCLTNYITFLEN